MSVAKLLARHGDEMRVIGFRVITQFHSQSFVLRLGGPEQPRRLVQPFGGSQRECESLDTASDPTPVREFRYDAESASPKGKGFEALAPAPADIAERCESVAARVT